MKEYDVIAIGGGSGLTMAYKALGENLKVALVAREYIGGTCMNVGCVPSKTLLYAADMAMQVEEAGKFGVRAKINSIDFPLIMGRVRDARKKSVETLRADIMESENLDFYEGEGRFVDEYTMQVGGESIRAKRIFIASGARPAIPPIKGLENIPYLTNETLLLLEKMPAGVIIIGGGYIGIEYAHFFAGMGSKVSIVEYGDRLVNTEEPEISQVLRESLAKRMEILIGSEALSVDRKGETFSLAVRDRTTGKERVLRGDAVLVATGRKSNADGLNLEKTGVELTPSGFIKVNDYLETTRPGIWAIGDATGKGMFTHAADYETRVAWHNAWHENRRQMDFQAVPHAVFTVPQIASIGLTEAEAAKGHEIMVGKARYTDVVQGDVRMEQDGFAKAIVEKGTDRILGFHIIGPEAAILIQEVVNVVARKESYTTITDAMHIFPALSEVVQETLHCLEDQS